MGRKDDFDMNHIIELRSEMRVRRIDRAIVFAIAAVSFFFAGFMAGYQFKNLPDLNRREAWAVAVEIDKKCREMFYMERRSLLAVAKCQEVFDVALNAIYTAREKKIKLDGERKDYGAINSSQTIFN